MGGDFSDILVDRERGIRTGPFDPFRCIDIADAEAGRGGSGAVGGGVSDGEESAVEVSILKLDGAREGKGKYGGFGGRRGGLSVAILARVGRIGLSTTCSVMIGAVFASLDNPITELILFTSFG